jgi:hypothetical protein
MRGFDDRVLFGLGDDAEAEGIPYTTVDPSFSYAEQFNAPSWLEVPAQALWFAMQTRINGDLPGSITWLQNFWARLADVKKTATEATWPEILALDAASQIQGANTLSSIINAMTADASTVSALMGPFGWTGTDAKAAIAQAQATRNQMLQQADDMAQQANTAQAARVQAVADGRLSQDDAQAAIENTTLSKIIKANSSLLPGGVPMWAYGVGALALLFILKGKR